MDDIRKFLSALFENKPEDTYIAIWQTPLKRTKRFQDIEKCAKHIEYLNTTKAEIYYCCGLQDQDHGSVRRGRKKDIVGLPGFYIDIDIKDEVHKNKNLPKTMDEAMSLIYNNGFDPTMIVHTGHGIHAHWIFKEPEMFSSDKDREESELMCRRIQETIKLKASKKGYSLDSTFDSARALRVPGTFNRKNNEELLVKITSNDGPNYSTRDDFDEFSIAADQLSKVSSTPTTSEWQTILSSITLNENAEPPPDRLDMLIDIDPKFRQTWAAKRDPKSFPKGKATPSEYALSLASVTMQAGWNDQEIANLIIAWNRRHGHDMKKATRGDYIARTLAVAKKDVDQQIIADYKENIEPTEGTEYHSQLDPEGEKTREALSKTFGFKIIRLEKHPREKRPWYVMYTDRGDIHFDTGNELFNRNKFKMRIAEEINIIITVPPRQWPGIEKKFTIIMVEIKGGVESTIVGRMKVWMSDYLENKRQFNQHQTAASKEPFVHKNHWYVYKEPFSRWCYNHKSYLEGVKKTELDLVLVGAEEKQLNPNHPNKKGKRTTRRAYKIPHSVCQPDVNDNTEAADLDASMISKDSDNASTTIH